MFSLITLFQSHNLTLKREGRTYKTCCPFHDDATPSLSVDPQKGLWRCFGCGEGGDAITFLQKARGLSFGEAADLWREMSGEEPKHRKNGRGEMMETLEKTTNGTVKSPRMNGAKSKPNSNGSSPPVRPELLERMAELYATGLAKSKDAIAYLAERGITDTETMRAFRLGYVDGSCAKLAANRDHREALTDLGILNERGTETLYGCVVVPLTDKNGQVTGFWGRSCGRRMTGPAHRALANPKDGSPSARLFHVQAAKGAANGELIIVEGFLDALACYESGIRNVMAIGGATNVDPHVIDLLATEQVKEVLLALDPDEAGDTGSTLWAEALERRGIGSKRVRLDVDPNEFFRTGGTVEGFRARADDGEHLGKPSEESELLFQSEGVLYRARLCGGPGSKSGKLRVHLLTSFAPRPTGNSGSPNLPTAGHRDTLDLYSHKARKVFANFFFSKLNTAFGEQAPTLASLEAGLETLIDKLERRSDERQSQTSRAQHPAMSPQERETAESFLSEPNLVSRLQADMNSLGYIGESEAKLLVYLIATSRKLPRPLSGIIGSGSGAGKSFLAELAELLMPPEDVEFFSKLTPQALYYLPEDYLFRKLLMLEERAGGEGADYALRTLQSKDKLTQLVTMKDPVSGNSLTRQFTVRGPIAYLETTTESYLNPENTSRCFEIPLDESTEQTRRIHDHQRLARSVDGLTHVVGRDALKRRHHNAQRLLQGVRVVIPYAQELTFPDRYLRTRRDHERFLSLIEAVAFLHQFQRLKKQVIIKGETVNYIEATPEDYDHAHALALKVLWVSLDELSRWGRELVDWMRSELDALLSQGVVEGTVSWTRREVREKLNWPDRRLREALDELVMMEHLEQRRGTPGNVFHYALSPQTKRARSRHLGLLTPEDLRVKLTLK